MKKLFNAVGLASIFTLCGAAYANPFLQLSNGMLQASPNQVMTLHFQVEGYDNADNALLDIVMNTTHRICLYATYDSGVCSGASVCSTVDSNWQTGKQMVAGSAFTLGFTVGGLNALATSQGSNPSNFKCVEASLAYSNYGGGNALTGADSQGSYTCEIAGNSSTFFAGNAANNPCRLNPTQMLIESS